LSEKSTASLRTFGALGLFVYDIWKQCIRYTSVSKLLNHYVELDYAEAAILDWQTGLIEKVSPYEWKIG
jgi:hypothetical protein